MSKYGHENMCPRALLGDMHVNMQIMPLTHSLPLEASSAASTVVSAFRKPGNDAQPTNKNSCTNSCRSHGHKKFKLN